MQNGQLLFVILFIIAITFFSFLREKKRKPRVLFFGEPFQNQLDLLVQMQMIAGYAYDFSWENIQESGRKYFDTVEKIIYSKKPKVIFVAIDLKVSMMMNEEMVPVNLPAFEHFCRKHALSLQEKGLHLSIILHQSANNHFEKVEMILKEFVLPIINLDEFMEPGKDENADLLPKKEIEKLASRINAYLDSVS